MQISKKFKILALIFVSVVINYMDRTNISVAASAMSEDLALTTVEMGLIFSAFAWTYSIMQIPGGMIVDTVKVRLLYPFILIAWSLATIVQGLVSSLNALIGCRMAIGLFEAPSYPANNKIVTQWFDAHERGGAIAVYTSGQFIGLAFLMPVLAVIQEYFGWRGLFVVSGIIGIVWAFIWYWLYLDAPQQQTTSEVPRQKSTAKDNVENWQKLKYAFSQKKLWGVYIGQFCLGGTMIFFLTWFPTYLAEERGLGDLKTGLFASIPFLAAFVGVLLSGFASDRLVKMGYSIEFARKTPIMLGLLLSSSIVGANFVDDMLWVTVFLSISFFGNGLASINWVFVSLIAPKSMVGLVGGCFNFIGGLAAVIVPVAIGYLAADGSFSAALTMIACLAAVGFLSYIFLVGKVEQLPEPQTDLAIVPDKA